MTETPEESDSQCGDGIEHDPHVPTPIERELLDEGKDLPNRGIPSRHRTRVQECSDADELRQLIETETEKEHPNQQLIGWVNTRLAEVSDE